MSFPVKIRDSFDPESEWTRWSPAPPSNDDYTSFVEGTMMDHPQTNSDWPFTNGLPPISKPTGPDPKSTPSDTSAATVPSPAQETQGPTQYESTAPSKPYKTSPYPTGTDGSSTAAGYGPISTTSTQTEDSSQHSNVVKHVAMAVVPLAFLAILGVILFLYIRRRRRQKHQALVQQEIKRHSPTTYSPAAQQQAYYHAPPGPLAPALSPMPPQPVILGPIVPNSNGAYYTGIDTSDVVSMHETQPQPTGLGNPFVDPVQEEPPPPYRPRSLAPLSRDTSLRSPPPATLSQTNLIAATEQIRSPFRDPHDDDNISEFSATGPHYGRRTVDELSVVSDLSYQQDPVVNRPAV